MIYLMEIRDENERDRGPADKIALNSGLINPSIRGLPLKLFSGRMSEGIFSFSSCSSSL